MPATTDIRSPGHKAALPAAAKLHCDLVRAVLSARFAHLVRVCSPAFGADVIGVETGDVGHGGNQHAVAIDVARRASGPGEVHCVLSLYLVAIRTSRQPPSHTLRRAVSGQWSVVRDLSDVG
jgi:hypothetical protein